MKAWKQPGDITNVAMLNYSDATLGSSTYKANVAAARSSQWLLSTNYLEINNIMLSYQCSKKFCNSLKMKGLKVYASADHLALLSARRGTYLNRTVSTYTSHGANALKPARTISVGIPLSL